MSTLVNAGRDHNHKVAGAEEPWADAGLIYGLSGIGAGILCCMLRANDGTVVAAPEPDVVGERLARLDLELFKSIKSQSFRDDKRGWMILQRAVRQGGNGYVYLEIGSHLGGSVQQHLVDPRCRRIYSIDKRPAAQPDERGRTYQYRDNSTARMLENLRGIDAEAVGKVVTFDSDASEIPVGAIDPRADFSFIDGEHTRAAVLRDFMWTLEVTSPDGVIAFHDDYIVHAGLVGVVEELDRRGVRYEARKMPGATFAIFLGNCAAFREPSVRNSSVDGKWWLGRKRWTAAVLRSLPDRWVRRGVKKIPRLLGMPTPRI